MKILKPVLLTLICALFLAFTNQRTHGTIESNQRHYEERILRELVDGAELRPTAAGYAFFRDGDQVGTIRQASTRQGYNGLIELLVAMTLDGEVINVRVIRHKETPGIGDKIDRDVSDWIDQFAGKSVDNSRWKLKPAGDIDGLSGATITSNAVTDAVHQVLVP